MLEEEKLFELPAEMVGIEIREEGPSTLEPEVEEFPFKTNDLM